MRFRRVATLLAALLLVGCSSADDESADESSSAGSSDTPSVTTAPSTATPSSLPDPAAGGDLTGNWTADVGDILAANTVNIGGAGAFACSGPIVMTFSDDGSYDRSGAVTCAVGETSFRGDLSSVGRWETSGSSLIISGTVNSGTILMGDTEIPVPDSFGDGTAEYSVVDDTLTITFTIEPVGTVAQIYVRSA